jgi:hypothetical protein
MRQVFALFLLMCICACNSGSTLSKNLNCDPDTYENLELVEDVDKRFKIQLPKNWKTNLYYDKNQTSIYSADTTKNLTDTYTVDVTYIYNELTLDQTFIQKFKTDLYKRQLVETTSYEFLFQNNEAYYSRALGKRGKFNYEICNIFIKVNSGNYIHAKAEVYGDSLINERLCNAFSLIEKIEYQK